MVAITILTPFLFISSVQPVHAQAGLFGCTTGGVAIGGGVGAAAAALGLVVPTLDNANLVVNTGSLTKECVLDGITVLLRELLIANITRSIVSWINNGFEGKPAFVQDLGKFLLNVADEVAGTFIEGSELAFLCSPFRVDVKIAIALDYYAQFRDRTACTLTGVLDNIDGAFDDLTSNRGWDTWFELSTNPNNNAVGAFVNAQTALYIGIETAQGEKKTILDWGQGFQPFQECVEIRDERGDTFKECKTVTPGTVINNQLNTTISSGQRQLELADEIDEIIGALIGQLSKQILGGVGGLLGASQSSYSRPSYLDQAVTESQQRTKDGLTNSSLGTTDGAISLEQQYIDSKKVSLQRLNTSENSLKTLQACYASKVANSSFNSNDRTIAQQRVESASTTIATSITPFKISVSNNITQAETNIGELVLISDHLNQASSLASVERIISTELNPLLENKSLHTYQDLIIAQQQRVDIGDILTSLDTQTTQNIATCTSFPNDND